MKNKVILGTVVMLASVHGALPALASQVTDQVRNDAEIAVVNQQVVSAEALHRRGDEYTREFLVQFHNATQKYCEAYQLGKSDAEKGQQRSLSDSFQQAAYQRGFNQGKSVEQDNRQSIPVEQQTTDATKAQGEDQATYPRKRLLPNQAQFINHLAKMAQEIGNEYDLYPSIIIAQAALESNWGTSDLSVAPCHNLFGVKGTRGAGSVLQPTTEFINSRPQQIKDYFRSYESDWHAIKDYAETLTQPLYHRVHRSATRNYREATRALVGRYATDPQYDRKLNRIIDAYHLTKYDEVKKDGGEKERLKSQPFRTIVNNHSQPVKQQQKSEHRPKVSPVVSVIGGAVSAGALTGLKKLIAG